MRTLTLARTAATAALALSCLGVTTANATTADTPAATPPKYRLVELPTVADADGCLAESRSEHGLVVYRCPGSGLLTANAEGRVTHLALSTGQSSFHLEGRTVIGARDVVAGAGTCTIGQGDSAVFNRCLARWDSHGALSLRLFEDPTTIAEPLGVNRHGDLVVSTVNHVPPGKPNFGSAVWWGNGKFETVTPSTAGRSFNAIDITDSQVVYGTERVIPSARGRALSDDAARHCLKTLRGAAMRVQRAEVAECTAVEAEPARWRRGAKAVAFEGLPGHTKTALTAVSDSGNHVMGFAINERRMIPVVWHGRQQPALPLNGFPEGLANRSVTWVNNRQDFVGFEVESQSGTLDLRSWVGLRGVPHELSTLVVGVDQPELLFAEHVNRDGSIQAQAASPDSEALRLVLLVPEKTN